MVKASGWAESCNFFDRHSKFPIKMFRISILLLIFFKRSFFSFKFWIFSENFPITKISDNFSTAQNLGRGNCLLPLAPATTPLAKSMHHRLYRLGCAIRSAYLSASCLGRCRWHGRRAAWARWAPDAWRTDRRVTPCWSARQGHWVAARTSRPVATDVAQRTSASNCRRAPLPTPYQYNTRLLRQTQQEHIQTTRKIINILYKKKLLEIWDNAHETRESPVPVQ